MAKIILVVVAHKDDETIGMGGTIKKHIDNGDQVYVTSMTNGVGAREDISDQDIKERKNSAQAAGKILGFKWIKSYNYDDNALDTYPLLKIVKSVEEVKKKCGPNIVYTHSSSDLNIDHRIVNNAVLTAFRPQPDENCKEIRLFEVASATDYSHNSLAGQFIPNLFISIDKEWQKKSEALYAYKNEIKEYPHSRSIEAIENLAKIRGNQIGRNIAEAFEVIRKIDD